MAADAQSSRCILVVEDEQDLAHLIQLHLGDLGYEAEVVAEGPAGLSRALERPYALIILDVMLPGLDGFEIVKRLRAEDRYVPVLMLTAKSEELDKVLGLELGADDYLTKPFSIRELIARVKALLRRVEVDRERSRSAQEASAHAFGPLRIEGTKRRVTLDGRPVELTAKEFDLLLLFARNPGRAYSRQELLDEVWGYQYSGYSHTVNTHINRLRSKIEVDPSNPYFIQTVWGVGYRFVEPEQV